MENPIITSEPPAKTKQRAPRRKVSAAGRKAISEAAKARWAAKKSESITEPISAPVVAPPSPAVLQLQDQVVTLVSQRQQARILLNESHSAYLAAQARFQAAENELKGIEQEVQYRIHLIAQLENRSTPQTSGMTVVSPQALQMPGSMQGVTSEPSGTILQVPKNQQSYAMAGADDLRRELRGMM